MNSRKIICHSNNQLKINDIDSASWIVQVRYIDSASWIVK